MKRRGMSCSALASAYLLDWIMGDPEWFPHPVRLIGLAIDRGERLLYRSHRGHRWNLFAGGALTFGLVGMSYVITKEALLTAGERSQLTGRLFEVLLAWTCLASRNLHDEASSVLRMLEADDLVRARLRLARIVGRDTEDLDEHEISRALIETLAESSCDGIVAPLFYLALGGVPLAMAFKTISTLDSMSGYTTERYFYFGKIAARLDDTANYVPARLAVLAIIAAAAMDNSGSSCEAIRIWMRDGDRHKSPNAGQPEAAMAGALRVRLGSRNTYDGEQVDAPVLGAEFLLPTKAHAVQAIRLTAMASILGFVSVIVAFTLAGRKRCAGNTLQQRATS